MRFNRFIGVIAITLALWNIGRSPLFAQEEITADQRLPDGVLLYVSVPNVVAAHEKFKETRISQLINDPQLEKFRQQLVDKYNDAEKKVQEEVGIPISDITALFSGELTLAVVRPAGQSLGGVLFMDIGNHQDILDKLIAKAEEADEEKKAEKETEMIDGQKITTYTISSQEDASGEPVTVSYFVKDQKLVVASAVTILESVLDLWDGKSEDSFAGNAVYGEIIDQCTEENSEPAVQYFVDPVGLLASGLGMNPDTQLFAGMVYSPAFGLNGFKGMGGVMEFATEEFDSISRAMYYVDGPASGILKIFEFRPTISAPPEWVPANAGQFIAFDWNIKGAYEAIESLYDSFTGPGKFAQVIDGLSKQEGSKLHIKNDVVDVLSGQIQWYLLPGNKPEDLNGTLAIGVKDAEKGQHLVDTVMELVGASEKSEFKGVQLSVGPGDGTQGAAAVKDNFILVARTPEQLKTTLTGPAKAPLVDSRSYDAIAENIPEKVSLLAYQNPADQLQAGYEKARAGEFDSFTEGKLDLSVLPPFDVLRKYFAPSASYFVPDEHGTLGVQFSLKRKD